MCSVIDQIMFLLLGLKSSARDPLPVEKGPGSIAPLRAELWLICLKIEAKVPLFVTTFSNAHISGLEWSF